MTKTHPRQLELPVMVNVKGRSSTGSGASQATIAVGSDGEECVTLGFHKSASVDDQSIYKAISDNYFKVISKQV